MLVVSVICNGCGLAKDNNGKLNTETINSQTGSGVYIYGAKDIFSVSPNVYIGEVISITPEITTEVISEERTLEFISADIKVQQVFKGTGKVGNVITDELIGIYKDFLEVGKTYLFMTGIEYRTITAPVYYGFNLYEAVELVDDTNIRIFRLEEYEKEGKYEQNHMVEAPRNYQELLECMK